MYLVGKPGEVDQFMSHFTTRSHYKIIEKNTTEEDLENKAKTTYCNFEFLPEERQEVLVRMQTECGEVLEISLLDGRVLDLGNGFTLINGKVLDALG